MNGIFCSTANGLFEVRNFTPTAPRLNPGWRNVYANTDHIVHVATELAIHCDDLPASLVARLPLSCDGLWVWRNDATRDVAFFAGRMDR